MHELHLMLWYSMSEVANHLVESFAEYFII